MRVKMILPALQEAESPYWRPIEHFFVCSDNVFP